MVSPFLLLYAAYTFYLTMKRLWICCILCWLAPALPMYGQQAVWTPLEQQVALQPGWVNLAMLMSPDEQASASEVEHYQAEWQAEIRRLQARRPQAASSKAFVEQVFKRLSGRYLKHFQAYSTFAQLMRHGDFNCLTGSMLISYGLSEMGIPHQIHETNFHIYLTLQIEGELVLLEANERGGGFISQPAAVAARLREYQERFVAKANSPAGTIPVSQPICRLTSLSRLSSLQYYNNAVRLLNAGHYPAAYQQLVKAQALYPSARNEELLALFQAQASR